MSSTCHETHVHEDASSERCSLPTRSYTRICVLLHMLLSRFPPFVVVTNITQDRKTAAVAKIVYSTGFRRGVRLTIVPRHVRISSRSTSTETSKHISNTSIIDIINDMISPMIAKWIDANMEQLVEKVIKREIEQIKALSTSKNQ